MTLMQTLLFAVALLALLPFVVYAAVKAGTHAYLITKRRFRERCRRDRRTVSEE